MQHVIIFDSADGTGKTNIAQGLSKRLGVPYFKNTRERKFFERDPGYFVKALKYGDPYFVTYLKQTGASVILDRSYPSEWVYSRALGRPTDHDILRMVDTMYADVGAKIVIPFRSDYTTARKDQFDVIDLAMLQRLDELYEQFQAWTSCETFRLCVDDEDLERELSEIVPFVEK